MNKVQKLGKRRKRSLQITINNISKIINKQKEKLTERYNTEYDYLYSLINEIHEVASMFDLELNVTKLQLELHPGISSASTTNNYQYYTQCYKEENLKYET